MRPVIPEAGILVNPDPLPWNDPENDPENKPFSQSTVTVVPSDLINCRLFQFKESTEAESYNILFSESMDGFPLASAISTPLPAPAWMNGILSIST